MGKTGNKKTGGIRSYLCCVGIGVTALFLTCAGAMGRSNVYLSYHYSFAEQPLLALPLMGFSDGVYPFGDGEYHVLRGSGDPYDNAYKAAHDKTVIKPDINMDGMILDKPVENRSSYNKYAVFPTEEELAESEEPQPEDVEETADETADAPEEPAEYAEQEEETEEEIIEEEPEILERGAVTDDYFCDALFLGDSRTVGLSEYCEELDERAQFYAKTSLTIYGLLTKEFIKDEEGTVISVDTALQNKTFRKIYIMIGINELGIGNTDHFISAYSEVLDRIKQLQPDAVIFIQSIMHVTRAKDQSERNIKNEKIDLRNEALSGLADDERVFFLDMNSSVDDGEGNLRQELSFDGVHLKAKSYNLWYDYLKQNAVIRNEDKAFMLEDEDAEHDLQDGEGGPAEGG